MITLKPGLNQLCISAMIWGVFGALVLLSTALDIGWLGKFPAEAILRFLDWEAAGYFIASTVIVALGLAIWASKTSRLADGGIAISAAKSGFSEVASCYLHTGWFIFICALLATMPFYLLSSGLLVLFGYQFAKWRS
jgi:hypothetical protein